MKKKHDWNTWENYLRVHESVLKRYQPHFLTPNTKYTIIKLTDQYYVLRLTKLELITSKRTTVLINIEKDIEVQAGARKSTARTVGYSYQAWIKGGGNVLRYDNPHETHNKFHHKHTYHNNQEVVTPVANDQWPHVNEFFDELIDNF